MSTQLIKLLAPAILFLAAGTASAGHGGGGHGGHGHGGFHSSGHRSGFHTVHRGSYFRSYSSFGYGGYGYGYGGYSYPSYGYSYPASNYYYPNSYYTVPGGVIPVSGSYLTDPTPAPSAVPAPAIVTVVVPQGAQVWFDGKEATGTGTDRVFTSPTLQPSQPATLAVKASWGGNTYSMQLSIRAGDKSRVDLR
jgi:uncharacterized protein (TIGR03000 family)